MNLYQTYRPTTLDAIVGHKKILKDLRNRFKNKTIAKCSYLTGKSGIGKCLIGSTKLNIVVNEKLFKYLNNNKDIITGIKKSKKTMYEITCSYGKLFKAISELENHTFMYDEEYYQKSEIKIKDEYNKWINVKALIKKKDKTIDISFSDGTKVSGARTHLISLNNLHYTKLQQLHLNQKIIDVNDNMLFILSINYNNIEKEVFDIMVDSKSHLYQTANGIVHHNTTIARIIAKALTCTDTDKNGNPCNKCKFCMNIHNESFNLACYSYMAGDLKSEDVKIIKSHARTKSLTSKIKVFFIDELQELSGNKSGAQKLLLDILELKMKNTYFILGSMDDNKVHQSIRNRSVIYRLRDIEWQDIAKELKYICNQEKIKIDETKAKILFIIAENSDGSLRNAISYLERCITSELWTEKEVIEELGLMSADKLMELTNKLLQGDMSLMQNKINKYILNDLHYNLLTIYKKQCGVILPDWLKKKIGGLYQIPKESVIFALTCMNDVRKYIYLDQFLIDYTLVTILDNSKKYLDKIKVKETIKKISETNVIKEFKKTRRRVML